MLISVLAPAKAPIKKPVEIAPTATPEATQEKTVNDGTNTYTYDYFTVSDPNALTLIPNFSKKADAKTLFDENRCMNGINGGFYDTANKPLGEFQVGGTYYGGQIENELVNGFVWADASGSAIISSNLPYQSFRFALQTGPILLFNGLPIQLTINNDIGARRMVAAKSRQNQLIFLAIYNGDAVFDGPKLADVPTIIQNISNKEKLAIADAINLDGGSASTFYHGDTVLSELSPIGSLFCVIQ